MKFKEQDYPEFEPIPIWVLLVWTMASVVAIAGVYTLFAMFYRLI